MKATTFKTRALSCVSGVIMVSALCGAPAVAQNDGEEDAVNRLGTVMVTARKVEENLQDVPVAVTAFTGGELEAKGVVDVGDVANFTPGFTTREGNSNAAALTMALRGQLQNDVLATLDPSVGTYVDEVYWSRAYGLNFNLLDMESVQVLKGPQGTLFGRNTTGGALVFTSADPDTENAFAKISGTFGEFNEQTFEAIGSVPIVKDKAAIRVALRSSDRDGYVTDILTGEEYYDRDVLNGRVKLLFAPTETVEIVLSAEHYEQSMNGGATGTIFATGLTGAFLGGIDPLAPPVPPSPVAFTPVAVPNYTDVVNGSNGDSVALDGNPFLDIETQTYTGKLSWDVGPGTFKLIAAQRNVESTNNLDLDGFAFVDGDPLHTTGAAQDLEQTSLEAQFAGTAGDNFQYVVGATWFEESGFDETFTDLRVVPNPIVLRFLGDVDNKSIGIYGQGTYDVSDRLSVTAGVRWSEDEKGVTTRNGSSVGISDTFVACDGGQAPPCDETYSDTFDDISYTLGADFDVSDTVMVYGKFSRGYRSGGQNLRLSGVDNLQFDPETVDEFEIGLKSDLLQNTLRLNLAAYSNEISDAQRSIIVVLGSGNATVVQNAAGLSSTGFEADLLWAPVDGWTFQAGASVIDQEYDEYIDNGVDVSDRHILGIPDSEFSLAATYDHSFSFADMTARVDYAWRDSYFNNELAVSDPTSTPALQNAITSPSSDVLNARLGLDFGNGWDLSIWGRNVLDDRSNVGSLYLGNFGYVNGKFREPATYGVTASFTFGGE